MGKEFSTYGSIVIFHFFKLRNFETTEANDKRSSTFLGMKLEARQIVEVQYNEK